MDPESLALDSLPAEAAALVLHCSFTNLFLSFRARTTFFAPSFEKISATFMSIAEEFMPSRRKYLAVALAFLLVVSAALSWAQSQPAGQRVSKVGVVKSITGRNVVLQPENGAEVNVALAEDARLLRLEPGQTDLRSAQTTTLDQIQPGDRLLVRGTPGNAPDSLQATIAVLMKQSDVAAHQQTELRDWQRRGAGGIVTAMSPADGTISISVRPGSSLVIKTGKNTEFLRYAPDSVKFTDAQKSAFDQIRVGDQLRARGARSSDGKELTAEEVISGTFRNIAGTISGIDISANTITVKDVLAKKTVKVKLTPESQMRNLPPQLAQRIAFFLKADRQSGEEREETASSGFGAGRQAAGRGAGADFQQIISRLPAVNLADLHKDDAVMIVSTPGAGGSEVAAITLLSGVEPILTASPNASGAAALLNGWNLSAPAEGGPQ